MDSDDVRAQVNQVNLLIQRASVNGADALANLQDTITGLKYASEQLQAARVYANEQLDTMAALNDQLELILVGTLSADVIVAQGRLKLAMRHVSDFLSRTQYHVNNIDKIRAVLNLQVQPSIEAPNSILKEIKETIEQWSRYL